MKLVVTWPAANKLASGKAGASSRTPKLTENSLPASGRAQVLCHLVFLSSAVQLSTTLIVPDAVFSVAVLIRKRCPSAAMA